MSDLERRYKETKARTDFRMYLLVWSRGASHDRRHSFRHNLHDTI